MPAQKPVPNYHCSQAELYACCEIGWRSFEENLADFAAFKTTYTAAFGAAAIAEVTAAKKLPDDQSRGAAPEIFRIQIKHACDVAINKWKSLRSYIKSGFERALVKPHAEAAGAKYYKTAANDDWEDVSQMLQAGKNFITNNMAALNGGGMPAAFPGNYDAAMSAFADLYAAFKDAEQDSKEGTGGKITANNEIYKNLIRMFEDGQLIYDKNAAKRKRFIFRQVLALVTTPEGSGEAEG